MVELTPEEHVVFQADGAVKIPKAVDTEWMGGILALADRQLAAPGQWVGDSAVKR